MVDFSDAYFKLLSRFPLRRAGWGPEPKFSGKAVQPMTYALIALSEGRGQDTLAERGRTAVAWLLRHSDLDGDGRPGWGLPQEWDAFGDGIGAAGTTNPPNHPYTITTALALEAIACAWVTGWGNGSARARARRLARAVVDRWTRDAVGAWGSGSYFWYSPHSSDAKFCPNVSSMMAGAIRATCHVGLTSDCLDETESVVDRAVEALIASVRDDAPYTPAWSYIEDGKRGRLNDAVHHAYTIWGLERYRESGGSVVIPWTTRKAAESCSAFFVDGAVLESPDAARPARLWGAGMCLAVVARYGEPRLARTMATAILRDYAGPHGPVLHPGTSSTLYPRHAAHLLLGLAELRVRLRADPTGESFAD